MLVSFPRMGFSYVGFKDLFERLGHEVLTPEKPNDETLELGTKYSPEFACVPYKIVLGSFIQSLEKGANFLVTSGGNGPCRAGHYAQLHDSILHSLGYDFDMVTLELPRRNFGYFLETLRKLNRARLSIPGLVSAFKHSWAKLRATDSLENLVHSVRAKEVQLGATTRLFNQALGKLENAWSLPEINQTFHDFAEKIRAVPQKTLEPLRIGLVGEIYVLLEPYANLNVEEFLGSLGVIVDRSIFITGWAKDNAVTNTMGQVGGRAVKEAAKPYLPEMIGGHGQDSIGHAVIYSRQGYDGMIHLSPFTCIPEIVAKSILPKVWQDLDFPVLSLACDELSGRAGLETRVEAFVDMLYQRRARREEKDHD